MDAFLRQPKVSKFAVAFRVDQNIFRFEIAVHYVERVNVVQGQYCLSDVKLGLLLCKYVPLHQVVGKVTLRAQVQDHVQVLGRLK